uniref:E3 ubiquitin protein ligase n=2 Tax=Coturnix japonica TaxID=93934 RepID=A0A8C2SXG7_COTJA
MSGVGTKRGPSDGGGAPPEKRPPPPPTTLIEPLRLGGISSTEEMDLKVLQFKNKKLAERLEQRQAVEDELRERIEKLEKRQATDDATLMLVNRYWGVNIGVVVSHPIAELGESGRALLRELLREHRRLERGLPPCQDKATSAETKVLEMETTVEGLQWDSAKLRKREGRLDRHLAEAMEQLTSGSYGSGSSGGFQGGQITLSMQKVALRSLPEEAVKETLEYKVLQSQFSLLYHESLQVKTQLDEARALLLATKNSHLRHIEHMESDELGVQKRLRTEVIQLEDTLAQVRKEYEMLRIEFEQTLAANEQAGPINREMRHLISSLQNHNHQLKGDVQRYKRKLREVQAEIGKVGGDHFLCRGPSSAPPPPSSAPPPPPPPSSAPSDDTQSGAGTTTTGGGATPAGPAPLKEEDAAGPPAPQQPEAAPRRPTDDEEPSPTTSSTTTAQESQKEMKLLLDMYKSAPKEQRDKVQLMAAERKSKAEAEELRGRARELEERERRESKKLADEEALRRLRAAEESIEGLQRRLAATKQEEEALLSEMDVTGQAFEDMQEQNLRLMQQLREKDDANFKLMSERIKANQIHKLLREEKDELAEQVLALKAQVDAQLLVVQKLEEKERVLQGSLAAVEKELAIRTQALELNKRKAVEAAQLAEDLRAQGEHVQSRLRELQACAAENRAAKDKESLSLKRAQEELSRLRRKLEKQRKVEVYADADQILQEEIKEYRARLTCPCCNARKKDAVLTKCFHVFCFECVKSRYDTRQRKCPKCNAAFGAHDFHRVYIS